MPKKSKKNTKDFDFQAWITNQEINKYLKIDFINSIPKEPKSETEAKKYLKQYLGEK